MSRDQSTSALTHYRRRVKLKMLVLMVGTNIHQSVNIASITRKLSLYQFIFLFPAISGVARKYVLPPIIIVARAPFLW